MRRLIIMFSFVSMASISSVLAGSMDCGTQIISDEQRDGQSKAKILEICGEPKSKKGNTWYYEQPDGTVFRLHFSGSGELQSIQESVE